MSFRQKARSVLDLVAALAMIGAAVILVWTKAIQPALEARTSALPSPERVPNDSQSLAGAAVEGSQSAPLGIIEYADFECPACASFVRQTFPQLMRTYIETGQVRFYFRHFPLPNHQFARPTAVAAHCAGEQGRFWPFYEYVYRLQPRLDEQGRQVAARRSGLDVIRWSGCIERDESAEAVDDDFESGRALELHGTPTFLIGIIQADGRLQATGRLHGAQGFEVFRKAIVDAELMMSGSSKDD